MNVQQLRQSLKLKWLSYYYKNRDWIVKMQVWGTYDGKRRPSSSFILATVSILEPQLVQLFPLVIELSNNPDRIVAALGLNFNPDTVLKSMLMNNSHRKTADNIDGSDVKMLPKDDLSTVDIAATERSYPPAWQDEMCEGSTWEGRD